MPTVRRIGSARFFFYSNEGTEPPHIHAEEAGAVAKFWLEPVSLGFVESVPSTRPSSPGTARGRTSRRVSGGMACALPALAWTPERSTSG